MNATAGQAEVKSLADRFGVEPGMVVMEMGYDDDVDQVPTPVDQGVAEILVHVVVVAHLHNDHARFDAEPVRQALHLGLARGRVHCPLPPVTNNS